MISYQSTAQSPGISPHFFDLVGNWSVEVDVPGNENNWIRHVGSTAEFSILLDSTFLVEDVVYRMAGQTLTMHLIYGVDPRTKKYRVLALDKEFGTMDVYAGEFNENTLVVDNLDEAGFPMADGSSMHFRLSYYFDSPSEHRLFVDFTKDAGENWAPFQRIYYKNRN